MQLSDLKPKLIVGLGNTGSKYRDTRHNAGFIFLDSLQTSLESIPSIQKKSPTYTARIYKSLNLSLLWPLTMMNFSGKAVKEFTRMSNTDTLEVLVVHDDLDLRLGEYKLQYQKSPKAHNGIISIEESLGSKDFYRLRIGVDSRTDRIINGSDYVLMPMNNEELIQLDKTVNSIIEDYKSSLI